MGQYYRPVTKDKEGNITAYSRAVDGEYTMAKLTEHSWWDNPFVCTLTKKLLHNPMQVAWVGDYAEKDEFDAEERLCEYAWGEDADEQDVTRDELRLDGKFLVNHSQKVYLNCNAYKENSLDGHDWILHPLPLLTAIGNGKGGGDYRGCNANHVGDWCWDLISVEDAPPEGYREVEYTFIDY
ncbi:MAG: hypothetical protein VZR73_16540 [Acutalibacteraceae bacterium]|nr:hypothetical protein [Acutalibacteraceae bacterium]